MLTNGTQSNGVPVEERVVNQVRTLQAWYAAELERRLAALTEVFKTHLQIQVEELQQHYERRAHMLQASLQTLQANAQASAGAHNPEKLVEEIQRTEVVLQKCASELERMVADDTVNLGQMLQKRNQQLEVRAYLRGLKYAVEGGRAFSGPEH
jgi:hypothetical protein